MSPGYFFLRFLNTLDVSRDLENERGFLKDLEDSSEVAVLLQSEVTSFFPLTILSPCRSCSMEACMFHLSTHTEFDYLPQSKECLVHFLIKIKTDPLKQERKRKALNVSLVLDRSGSMGGKKMEYNAG